MAVKPKQAPRKAGAAAAAKTETRIFHVAFQRRRSIWREIELRPHQSLYTLAEIAVQTFGFDLDHAFGFYPGSGRNRQKASPKYELFTDIGEPTSDDALGVETVSVATAFPTVGKRMTLLFDYGDEWLFDVELIGVGRTEPHMRYPRLLRQRGDAPEQYPPLDEE
jgi:hypothetical protein